MPASQVGLRSIVIISCRFCLGFARVQIPQQRASFPQGLSEEALKEALQVPCIWVESQDLQETRSQEVEREVGTAAAKQRRQHLPSTTSGCLCFCAGSTSVSLHTEGSAALRPGSFTS